MTRVDSINSTRVESPYSVFGSISKGIAGGALLGYAAKYMLPLSEAEKDKEYNLVINHIKERAKELKGLPIDAIRNLEEKTPAQDVFLKMVDAENGIEREITDIKNGETKKIKLTKKMDRASKMRELLSKANLDEEGRKELKNIIAQVNEKAINSRKYFIKSYNAAVKEMKRPTIAFVTAGAVAGFFAGLAHKIIAGQLD